MAHKTLTLTHREAASPLRVLETAVTGALRAMAEDALTLLSDPILSGWDSYYPNSRPYPAGSNGPEQAQSLLELAGREWHD